MDQETGGLSWSPVIAVWSLEFLGEMAFTTWDAVSVGSWELFPLCGCADVRTTSHSKGAGLPAWACPRRWKGCLCVIIPCVSVHGCECGHTWPGGLPGHTCAYVLLGLCVHLREQRGCLNTE